MSLLSSITNFAKNLFGVDEVSSTQKSTVNKITGAIIESSNTEKPIDTIEITQKNQENAQQSQSIGSLKSLIENKCNKYDINFQTILKSGILKESTVEKLKIVEEAVDKVAELEETRKLSRDINKAEYILSFANIVAEAVDRGLFESEEEFEEAKGNINEELGENFSELKTEEQKE